MKWEPKVREIITSGHVYDASLSLRRLDMMARRCLVDGYV